MLHQLTSIQMRTLLTFLLVILISTLTFSQNIGIGTTTPVAQFHTTGSVLFAGVTNNNTFDKVVVQDNSGWLYWRDAATVASQFSWLLNGNFGTDPNIHFIGTTDNKRFIFKTNSIERMTVLGNGNIGINTINPAVKLDIYSSTDNSHLRVSGKSPAIIFADGNNTLTNYNVGDIGIATFTSAFVANSKVGDMIIRNYGNGPSTTGSSADLIFASGRNYTSGNNSGFEVMRISQINNQGRLGIGVSAPLAQLHTNGNVMFTGITNNNSFNNVLVQDNDGTIYWRAASTFANSNNWSLNGNNSTNQAINFLGTNDNNRLVIKTMP